MSRRRRAEPGVRRSVTTALLRGGVAVTVLVTVLAATACDATMNSFAPAGEAAQRIASLGNFMLVLAAIVFVGVMIVLAMAVLRNRDLSDYRADLTPRSTRWVVFGGGVMPAVVLVTIFVVGMAIMGAFPARGSDPPALTIHVTGHQWWWEVQYESGDLQQRFTTANEIHIPVGRQVRVLLTSADVIHSFWVPRLQGKLDLIPGDTNDLRLHATEPGTYRGQCAEYCGLQHAHMGMLVVAESEDAFERWWGQQLTPGKQPTDSMTQLGQQLFVGGACALCHTVRGTPAGGGVAPDLTHVGSRLTLAAGTLPNSLGTMEAWITNAQSLKPGVRMPTVTQYEGRELRALASYLWSLK